MKQSVMKMEFQMSCYINDKVEENVARMEDRASQYVEGDLEKNAGKMQKFLEEEKGKMERKQQHPLHLAGQ